MEERVIRGVPWTILAYAGSKLVTVLTTVVLARLLAPADFGVIALALVAVGISHVFRDLGLNGTLILRQDFDREAQGTVLTLTIANGVLVGAAVAAASPLAASLFDEPRLAGVLAAMSTTVFLGGFTWFYEALLQRELEFRRRFIALIVQSLTYAAVAIALAAMGAGVWSLVAGQVAGFAALAVALLALAPYRVRPTWRRHTAVDALGTGRGFFLQGGLAFVSQNVDYMIVGRVLGVAQVGFYTMAYRMGELTYLGIAEPVAKATFPGFARMRHRGEGVRAPFVATLRLVGLICCPLGAILSGAADPFTRAIFGERWLPMIGPLAVLGLWAAVRPLQATVGWLLNSVGLALLTGVASAILLIPVVPLLFVATEVGGITAVAWVMLANAVVLLVLLAFIAARRAQVPVGEQWTAVLPVVIASATAWAGARGVAELTVALSAGAGLMLSVGAGVATYVIALATASPGLLSNALRQARGVFRKSTDQYPAVSSGDSQPVAHRS